MSLGFYQIVGGWGACAVGLVQQEGRGGKVPDEAAVVIQQVWAALASWAGPVGLQVCELEWEDSAVVSGRAAVPAAHQRCSHCALSAHQEDAVLWVVSMLVRSLIESVELLL